MDPLAIMPEEAWLHVIRYVNTLRDKQAAYNTCQLWRGLLKKKGTVWMFEGIFPLLIKYLSKSDILESRQVCKGWKGVIDSYLENDQPTIVAPGRQLMFPQRLPIRTFGVCFGRRAETHDLQPLEVMQQFQSEFETEQVSTCNPFVSRSLRLGGCITEMSLAMTIERFFEKFGVHLFSLQLYIWHYVHVPQEINTRLQIATFVFNILACVPNLRKLDLQVVHIYDGHPQGCLRCKMDARELYMFLNQNVAPPLPHLTNLQLYVEPLLHQALECAYAPQVETYAHLTIQNCFPTNLNNVTGRNWHQTRGCPINHLRKLKTGHCQPLQRLNINIRQCEGTQWHAILYQTVESFQSTLTHLSIQWDTLVDANLPKQLHMPFLQQLFFEVGCWHSPQNLNFSFLKNLKSIRKVKCAFRKLGFERVLEFYKNKEKPKYLPKMEQCVDLQYHLYDDSHGGPYKSNVWKLVPSLDRFEIQVVNYQCPRVITLYKFYTRGQKDKKVVL